MECERLGLLREDVTETQCDLFTSLTRAKEYFMKVDVPNSITYLNLTPISVWYVRWHGPKKE